MNQISSAAIKTIYPQSKLINISSAKDISDVGNPSLSKLIKTAIIFSTVFWSLLYTEIGYCYINLHPTGKVFFRDAALCLLAKVFRKKVVLHIHGRGISRSHSWLKKLIYKSTFKNTYVIHLSNLFFDEVSPFVERSKFIPIPNCTGDLHHLAKYTPGTKIQFYYLSNYMRGKGALDLLNAAKHIYRDNINCKFVLAGGWFEPDFKREIEEWQKQNSTLFENGYIEIFGALHGEKKDELIRNSDAFIFPSYIDTFPLVVLEALSAGKLIISTATGATPEILANGKAGILVPERNYLALAEKISEVIQNPDMLNVYSKAARQQYLTHYTEQHFKATLSKVIREITSQQAIG